MVWSPQVRRVARRGGGERWVVGHRLVDDFLEFAASRARPNTVRAYAHDLKAFFAVVGKEPVDVRPADVMAFITAQRRARGGSEKVVRIADGEAGLSAATIRRRLAAVSSFYGYLIDPWGRGGGAQPGPAGVADAAVSAPQGVAGPAAGAGGAPPAAHFGSRRDGRADGGVAH